MFLERVMTAAETDPIVADQFMKVTAMIDSPVRLLRPSILRRVAQTKRGRATYAQPVGESVRPRAEGVTTR
ncbi:MAG: hypothetical protein ACRDT5_04485 [Mycobacterium sp.]